MSANPNISADLRAKLKALPDKPGVYIFYDSDRRIIYVGKGKSLRARVRSYFTAGDDGRYQYPKLVATIRDVELLLTRSEVEALITEQALIHKHRPRFNVDFRDDKSYPYLLITNEEFPRVMLTRRPERDGTGELYGPFTDVRSLRFLLRSLVGVLQIRQCRLPLTAKGVAAGRFKLCLDYHIGLCGGPCEAKVSSEEYRRGIHQLLRVIQGHHDELVADLEDEMKRYASELRFEEAARVRDRLRAARQFTDRLVRVTPQIEPMDAVNFVREDAFAAFSVINVRGGRIVGQSPFYLERAGDLNDGELLEFFIARHYNTVGLIPKLVLLPFLPPDPETITFLLSQKAGGKVELVIPQRGEKRSLVQLARTNAEHILLERREMADKRDFVPRSLKAVQECLHLSSPPLLIEAFDVSHLHGTDTVASMVAFKDGKPWKTGYRLFKIRGVNGVDDFAAIGEAVQRRYSRLLKESAGQKPDYDITFVNDSPEGADKNSLEITSKTDSADQLPDLVVIDGGKGQLNAAHRVLTDLGLGDLPVIGLAKRLEEIFIPGEPDPMTLPRSSSALRLIQQLRDEAHRFAVSRHRLLRGKRQVRSKLDDIPGIGPQRRQALLAAFGSLKRLLEASVEEIHAVKGVPEPLARRIKETLGGQTNKEINPSA